VSFFVGNGSAPDPTVIYNEVNFAQPGQDRFYALQYVNTIHSELATDNPLFNTSVYSVVSSTVSLIDYTVINGTVYVGISFAFATLSAEFVFFQIGYQLTNFFGDFSGMIGTVLGLDAIKVSASFPLMFLAFKYKTISALADRFNG